MHSNGKDLPLHPYELVKDIHFNELKGVKVTFINMPLRESALPNTPPEGPAILASIVRQYGGEPYIIDLNGYRIKDSFAKKKGLPNGRHLTYDETEQMIERHVTLNHNMWGTDQNSSLEILAMDMLKKRIDDISVVIGKPEKKITDSEKPILEKLRG